jgi:pyrimidine operon attenuation protein/uracil phosphoribosyltransferase
MREPDQTSQSRECRRVGASASGRSVAARLAEDIGELQGVELEHGEIVARVFVHVMADGPGRLADTWEV